MKPDERWKEFLKTAKKPELFDDVDQLMAYMGYVWGVRGWGAQVTDFRRLHRAQWLTREDFDASLVQEPPSSRRVANAR
jgi:hypothetical protein